MTFAWIHRNRTGFSPATQCQVLQVSRSGYYAFAARTTTGMPSTTVSWTAGSGSRWR